jgi:amidophosphoribosyltransferase
VDEIRKYITADSLAYVSLEGIRQIVPNPEDYCTACFDNHYPIEFPGERMHQMQLIL